MPRKFLFFAVLLIAAGSVFAQSGSSVQAEIQALEMVSVRQGVTPAERHGALVSLARLRELSGDIEGAARSWLEAAAAIPGTVDDNALLACAFCLAAMGEWDRALAALEPLLSKNIRARFLDTAVRAIKTGDTSALASLAGNSEYSGMKHEILFLLWKITQGDLSDKWRELLASEFPQTPEGRLASQSKGNDKVAMKPSPFWFFAGGYDSLTLLAGGTAVPDTAPASVSDSVPDTAPAPQQSSSSQARLQTGVFSKQANANSQAAALKQAGFSPLVEQRGEMWAVVVHTDSSNTNQTIKDLSQAGFESFPVK